MFLFVILAPFAAFAGLMLVTTETISLFAGAAIAAASIIVDLLRGRSVKVLAAGATALFTALGLYGLVGAKGWGSVDARLVIDLGLLAIGLISIALRVPFTLQYAREMVEPEIKAQPAFIRTNYVLTWAWSGAFLMMVIADIASLYLNSLPVWACVAVTFAARNAAAFFTGWYSKYRRALFRREICPAA